MSHRGHRSLMFVGAHPDDDTFGVSRSVALLAADRSFRFSLVIATDGDAGEVAPDVELPVEGLGFLRRQEDADSWETLGRSPDAVVWLDFADGTLDRHQAELTARIADALAAERPDVVATFGPDGVTGHPDHVAVSRATSEAFHQVRTSVDSGLRRLVYGAIPNSDIDRWNVNRRLAGDFEWDPSAPFHIRGVADEMIGISVDTREVAPRMVEALRRHRSQWSTALMPIADDVLARSLRTEDWVIAWPPRAPGAERLASLFEGLD